MLPSFSNTFLNLAISIKIDYMVRMCSLVTNGLSFQSIKPDQIFRNIYLPAVEGDPRAMDTFVVVLVVGAEI